MSLFHRAAIDIVALHRFFVAWYDRSTADETDFSLFERAMGADMQIIPPSGAVLDRAAVIGHVRGGRASFDGDFAIEIDQIRPAWEADGAILVTYVEKQQRKGVRTARQATAFFTENPSAPNGVEWRHLHETWIQAGEK